MPFPAVLFIYGYLSRVRLAEREQMELSASCGTWVWRRYHVLRGLFCRQGHGVRDPSMCASYKDAVRFTS